MVTAIERIRIGVPDLARAVADFRSLLGVDFPEPEVGEGMLWLGLPNTVLELVQRRAGCAARIEGLVFTDSDLGEMESPLANQRGLALARSNGSESAVFRATLPEAQCEDLAVDHLVLRSSDPDGCIELFRDTLGIRLALDQAVPEWGGRMLFFRTGGLTLEVIGSGKPGAADYFWGLAYRCRDIDREVRRMRAEGVELSPVRMGRKPGTRVATIRSHHLEIPALLIAPA